MSKSLFDARELRKLGHQAVTEGVNLKYVERMRQALYAAADRIEALEAGDPPERPCYWVVKDEGDSLAYWGPYQSLEAASRSGMYDHGDPSNEIVRLIAKSRLREGRMRTSQGVCPGCGLIVAFSKLDTGNEPTCNPLRSPGCWSVEARLTKQGQKPLRPDGRADLRSAT